MNDIHPLDVLTDSDREIVISRIFNAPRTLVFEAFTNPAHAAEWWGPRGFTTTTERSEVRPGGVWIHTMHGPDGTDFPNHINFLEVVAPEFLRYNHGAKENDPEGFHVTVRFDDVDGNTRLTLRSVFASREIRDRNVERYGSIQGGYETLDRLAEYLPALPGANGRHPIPQLVMARTFDAPRAAVWQAWTDPDVLKHWWGPKGYTWVKCDLDLRPGGEFHYCLKSPSGDEMWGKFVYREVSAEWRMTYVVSFSDADGNIVRHPMSETWPLEMLSILTLNESSGRTWLALQSIPINATQEEMDTLAAAHTHVEAGTAAMLNELEKYLHQLTK